jgi:hypothetical protein
MKTRKMISGGSATSGNAGIRPTPTPPRTRKMG